MRTCGYAELMFSLWSLFWHAFICVKWNAQMITLYVGRAVSCSAHHFVSVGTGAQWAILQLDIEVKVKIIKRTIVSSRRSHDLNLFTIKTTIVNLYNCEGLAKELRALHDWSTEYNTELFEKITDSHVRNLRRIICSHMTSRVCPLWFP